MSRGQVGNDKAIERGGDHCKEKGFAGPVHRLFQLPPSPNAHAVHQANVQGHKPAIAQPGKQEDLRPHQSFRDHQELVGGMRGPVANPRDLPLGKPQASHIQVITMNRPILKTQEEVAIAKKIEPEPTAKTEGKSQRYNVKQPRPGAGMHLRSLLSGLMRLHRRGGI